MGSVKRARRSTSSPTSSTHMDSVSDSTGRCSIPYRYHSTRIDLGNVFDEVVHEIKTGRCMHPTGLFIKPW